MMNSDDIPTPTGNDWLELLKSNPNYFAIVFPMLVNDTLTNRALDPLKSDKESDGENEIEAFKLLNLLGKNLKEAHDKFKAKFSDQSTQNKFAAWFTVLAEKLRNLDKGLIENQIKFDQNNGIINNVNYMEKMTKLSYSEFLDLIYSSSKQAEINESITVKNRLGNFIPVSYFDADYIQKINRSSSFTSYLSTQQSNVSYNGHLIILKQNENHIVFFIPCLPYNTLDPIKYFQLAQRLKWFRPLFLGRVENKDEKYKLTFIFEETPQFSYASTFPISEMATSQPLLSAVPVPVNFNLFGDLNPTQYYYNFKQQEDNKTSYSSTEPKISPNEKWMITFDQLYRKFMNNDDSKQIVIPVSIQGGFASIPNQIPPGTAPFFDYLTEDFQLISRQEIETELKKQPMITTNIQTFPPYDIYQSVPVSAKNKPLIYQQLVSFFYEKDSDNVIYYEVMKQDSN